ncbi:MAG: ASKHA domain-containing protein, partial [Spirochaetaceae bacterium]|nr:ASKHA domain-containing protein [Spirochaetaceae bacterium]
LASESSINPQTRYAQDVLGRIRFAAKEEWGLAVLHNALLEAVNAMLDSLLQKTGVKRERIYEAVYAGNTTMLHLAAGVETAPLGQYPYTPLLAGAEYRGAAALNISPFGRVWFPPFVSAWVGADIVSGMLALRLDEKKGVTLFIDIGTNGEMVLARDGKLAASSTAAGPAFEGMNIRCGMRAGRGAIDSFTIEGDECVFTVIGGGEAEGICGSGLFDIAGELARTGVVEKNGRFAGPEKTGGRLGARLLPPPEEPSPQGGASPDTKGGKIAFYITGTVYISQKDIRQIQLAKGAIRCGIDMLLSRFGLAPSGVDAVEIAGSFGYHLRETSLLDTGLLPPEFAGKITFAGNTSLAGAAAFLLNRHFRGRMRNLAAAVETVELADDPAFEKNFVRCLAFPDKRSGGPEGKADA